MIIDGVDIAGVCSVCSERVTREDYEGFKHPCPGYSINYSPERIANPKNEPWLPGYRFALAQDSTNPGRSSGKMRTRVYNSFFQIGLDGILRHVDGVKPTAQTIAQAEAQYARYRPGSNGGPS